MAVSGIVGQDRSRTGRLLSIVLLSALLVACGQGDEHPVGERAIQIDAWLHAGSRDEQRVVQAQVAAFNASQYRVRVNAVILPEAEYDLRIQEAAAQGRLPDIVEVPTTRVARYAWLGFIRPIDKLLTDETHDRLFPPVRRAGSYAGRIYAIPSHARSFLLYARRDLLERQGIALPPAGRTWDLDRFSALLDRLATANGGRPVLEIDLGPDDHRATEALLPVLVSAGGGLIDLKGERPRILGVFDSGGTIACLQTLRDWATRGRLVARTSGVGGLFVAGTVPLAWAWTSDGDAFRHRWGKAVVVLPLPDFGQGPRFGIDAWGWAVSRDTKHAQAAMSLIEFMSDEGRVVEIARAGHALPSSRDGLSAWAQEGIDEAVVLDRAPIDGFVVTPRTPAYPLIARTLDQVVGQILAGQEPAARLHEEALGLQHKIAGFERDG